jgi:hypothetical protein
MINKERVDEGRREFLKYLCKGTAVVALAAAGMPLGGCGYSSATIGGNVDTKNYPHVPLHELVLDLYRDRTGKYNGRTISTTGYFLGFDIARISSELDMTTMNAQPLTSGQGQTLPDLGSLRTQTQPVLSPAERKLVTEQMPYYANRYGGLASQRMAAEIQAGRAAGDAAAAALLIGVPLLMVELGAVRNPACAVVGCGPLKLPMMFGAPAKENRSVELSQNLGKMLYRDVRVAGKVDKDDGFVMDAITPVPGCFNASSIPAGLELPQIEMPQGYTKIDFKQYGDSFPCDGLLFFDATPLTVKKEYIAYDDGTRCDELTSFFHNPDASHEYRYEGRSTGIAFYQSFRSGDNYETTQRVVALLNAYASSGEDVGVAAKRITGSSRAAFGVEKVNFFCFREGNIQLI